MIQKIYAIYDSKSEAYLQPFFLPAKGAAIRAFIDCVNDSNHNFGKHPGDYTLFEIGTFDDSRGHIDAYATFQSLGNGIEFLKSAKS